VFAYLNGERLCAEQDQSAPLVFVQMPGSGADVSLCDAFDLVGPLALRHAEDGADTVEVAVEYGDLDGVAVYRVQLAEGELLFPSAIVPVRPACCRRVQR